jgi:exodeoxyribonuclease VII large subunit
MRQEAIFKLRSTGLFERNKQHRIPILIQNLAVISVETSKGYRDFKEVIDRSPYKECVSTTLYPALLQGDAAVTSIQKALEKIKVSGVDYDAVAIIRGGGGETGLDCFDQFDLAKAVCEMPIPVISGIGHATNLTVVEQVSNQSFLTPTHLAQFIVAGYLSFQERIKVAGQKLKGIQTGKLIRLGNLLQRQAMKLEQSIAYRHNREKTYISSLRASLQLNGQRLIQNTGAELDGLVKNKMDRAIERKLNQTEAHLDRLKPALPQALNALLTEQENKLMFIHQKVQILDPINTLKRGFSITRKNGKPVLNSSMLSEGDELTTELWDGSIKSIVKKKNGKD